MRVLGNIIWKELQSYVSAQASVFGLVHDTHPAPAQLLDDAVVGNDLPDERVGVRHSAAILGFRFEAVNKQEPTVF